MPPNSSGNRQTEHAKLPTSARWSRSGTYWLSRCQPCAWGATSLSAKPRISPRICFSVSSRSQSPTVPGARLRMQFGEPRAVGGRVARQRSWRRASASSARAISVGVRPISPSRTISLCAHGDAASDLREIFADADADDEFLDFAEVARSRAGVRHRRTTGESPRHRSRARQAHGWRAVRGRTTGRCPAVDGDPAAHLADRVRQ